MSLLQLPHAQEHDFSLEDKNPAEGARTRARAHTLLNVLISQLASVLAGVNTLQVPGALSPCRWRLTHKSLNK